MANNKKVLLVDDDNMVREVCSELLSESGYTVITAINGIDALEKLAKSGFDIIILDVNMPKLDGIDFYHRASLRYPHLKERFLFITGDLTGELDALGTFVKEGRKVLAKPFKKADFLDNVRAITGE